MQIARSEQESSNSIIAVAQVLELRHRQIDPAYDCKAMPSLFLRLTLHIQNSNIEYPVSVANLIIQDAVDELGSNLKLLEKEHKDNMIKIDQDRVMRLQANGLTALPLEISLTSPPRNARRVARIKGSMDVNCFERIQIVDIKNLLTQQGKIIEDPALKKVGLNIKILGEHKKQLVIEFSGNKDCLYNFLQPHLFDADGKCVDFGHNNFSSPSPPIAKVGYSLRQALDDKIVLKLMIGSGIKVVHVPFELHDIALPVDPEEISHQATASISKEVTGNSDLNNVTVSFVKEWRIKGARKTPMVMGIERAGLHLLLNVKHPKIIRPSGYASWRLFEVIDDLGNMLMIIKGETENRPTALANGQFVDLNIFGNPKVMDEIQKTGVVPVELFLSETSRKANRLARVRGEVTIHYGGISKDVRITQLVSQTGKVINDDILQAAGIHMEVDKTTWKKNICLKYTGNIDALRHPPIGVIDANGNCVNFRPSGGHLHGINSISYGLKAPVDDSLTVIQTVLIDQESITIPFDLHDIPLP